MLGTYTMNDLEEYSQSSLEHMVRSRNGGEVVRSATKFIGVLFKQV
jgi:hypothetical protein